MFSPAYIFLLPSIDLHTEVSLAQRISKQTDWLGIIFLTGALTTFVMAIGFGGSVYDWSSASEIVLWVLSGLLTIAFALTQIFHPLVSEEHKLYPTHFLKIPTMVMLQVLMVCAAVSLFVSWSLMSIRRVVLKPNLTFKRTGSGLLHTALFSILPGTADVKYFLER